MFSKASDEWATPQEFYDKLDAEFNFDVDAAATAENAKCLHWLGPGSGLSLDALTVPWCHGLWHWLNPPYSRCKEFIAKAAKERVLGVPTVALVPARTDTKWFHEYLWDERPNRRERDGIELRFVRGRLKFGDGKNSAPFPSMVVVFRP